MNAAKRDIYETWIGAAIITALVLVVALVFGPNRLSDGSYSITARFSRADGLSTGGMVRAAGVPVGEIEELRLDDNFRAVIVLRLDDGVVLDSDATASIVTDGLFGQKFIQLDIGGSDAVIGEGQEITFTEDSLVLEDLLELIISRAKQVRRSRDAPTESQP
ncbi:MAG: MlaD family protein [Alphaproteobacteria bacterium]|nr:MlaD family protein [Alphaproteobacteria bacterium]